MLERKPSARERRLPQEEERAEAAAQVPDLEPRAEEDETVRGGAYMANPEGYIEQDNLRRSP